ncbi:hypothetical protein CspeluHIS016_0102610 [Cutaneotrichosporon spelunceum]|uniref:Pre-mRNA processing factor 4 (PRP4)-like domain-containing protein n=1 Tax=Cutaneotrichosporon spelunceum TaxID=1672016 RepID=A0AAD3Y7J2_9TREE|nr:hypothetical protein CspeluHIS016_0102610 [Cutaneotrichosporon spelunceum]
MDLDDLVVDNNYVLGGSDDEREREQNALLHQQLEQRKRMRSMAVPTDDSKVRERLRAYGEPITLFGEGPGDRRDRLKLVQERYEVMKGRPLAIDSDGGSSDSDEGEFYTEGSNELLQARRKIAHYSLPRAKRRVARQRIESSVPLSRIINLRKEVFSELQTFQNLGSQFGDDRPLSTIRFSPNSKLILTTSWTGTSKVWDLPNLNQVAVRRGHSEKISGAAWHPDATLGLSESAANFATGGAEGDVKLWSMDQEKPIVTLAGHTNRVGRVEFHPSGAYLGSAGFDGTWRLWDVETHKELLVQEGHSKEVMALAFQDDGALVASGGFDAIGRVWDTRTGRTAMVLDGHVKEILSMDFAPNGFQVATGSGDNTVRIWDLRALRTQHAMPAHKSSVSDVRFFRATGESPFVALGAEQLGGKENGLANGSGMDVDGEEKDTEEKEEPKPETPLPRSGLFLVTGGFDGHVRVWSADEWAPVRDLATDAGKVMSADVSGDGRFIASASYSRSFHLFGGDHSL